MNVLDFCAFKSHKELKDYKGRIPQSGTKILSELVEKQLRKEQNDKIIKKLKNKTYRSKRW